MDLPPKAKEIKAKINKWDLSKLNIFYTKKEAINKTKRLINWRKYLQIMAHNRLICQIYNSSYSLKSKNLNMNLPQVIIKKKIKKPNISIKKVDRIPE